MQALDTITNLFLGYDAPSNSVELTSPAMSGLERAQIRADLKLKAYEKALLNLVDELITLGDLHLIEDSRDEAQTTYNTAYRYLSFCPEKTEASKQRSAALFLRSGWMNQLRGAQFYPLAEHCYYRTLAVVSSNDANPLRLTLPALWNLACVQKSQGKEYEIARQQALEAAFQLFGESDKYQLLEQSA